MASFYSALIHTRLHMYESGQFDVFKTDDSVHQCQPDRQLGYTANNLHVPD
ncbi:hypothetical protein SALWKB29_0180 [Snodgrassella communis]|uniref:Uncharacterized protein n=1 Tax=Snodgrassella communis TaxID=2946699 RepID=A0A837AGM4_9NEIS|nr:hypothetical protein SALWKB29_0180 [Snodgrassella communis]